MCGKMDDIICSKLSIKKSNPGPTSPLFVLLIRRFHEPVEPLTVAAIVASIRSCLSPFCRSALGVVYIIYIIYIYYIYIIYIIYILYILYIYYIYYIYIVSKYGVIRFPESLWAYFGLDHGWWGVNKNHEWLDTWNEIDLNWDSLSSESSA